jgi:hypothetical protein
MAEPNNWQLGTKTPSISLRGWGDRLGDLTADVFRWWGCFVGRHPGKARSTLL